MATKPLTAQDYYDLYVAYGQQVRLNELLQQRVSTLSTELSQRNARINTLKAQLAESVELAEQLQSDLNEARFKVSTLQLMAPPIPL
jgi:hypothetical protein